MSKRVFLQVVFWIIVFIINMALSPMHHFDGQVLLFPISSVLFYAFLFYFNILYLFPRYYESRRRYYWFIVVFLILLGSVLLSLMVDGPAIEGRHRGPHNRVFEIFNIFKLTLWMVMVFLISTIYSIQQRLSQQTIRTKKMMEEKLQTELQLLKAQINPHFLFNALNNIYSLTYMQSEKAPESVLKLSEMLRYVIEDCCHESVPLKNELSYINSYIDFYKMKNPGERDIRFEVEVENTERRIAPMLFIPFVENSFKYSRIEEDTSGFIHIRMTEKVGVLTFTVQNSLFKSRTILPGSGKGISNVKQRLGIIYPDKYNLEINPMDDLFSVTLTLTLL